MAKHDRHFMNVFSAVLGVLVAIALLILGVSRFVDSGPTGARDVDDPLMQAEAQERTRPFGQVAVAGQDNSALAIRQPPTAAGSVPTTAALPADGPAAYQAACAVCHDAGIAGAPRTGDQAAWAPRIAKGMDTLARHAIEGFQGSAGVMPPKGGRADLPDGLVREAVEHMVARSR